MHACLRNVQLADYGSMMYHCAIIDDTNSVYCIDTTVMTVT